MTYRLGVDIGGTFTDLVLEDVTTGKLRVGKVLTSSGDPSDGVIDGIRRLLGDLGIPAEEVGVVIHGTTLATNAVIERTGAMTALLTTEGFIDVLEIGRESRYDHYDCRSNCRCPWCRESFGAALPSALIAMATSFGRSTWTNSPTR